MNSKIKRVQLLVLWILPTVVEIVFYIFITAILFAISSQDKLKEILYIGKDINPIRYIIASLDSFLQNIVGERVAGSLSLALFWGLVGLIVNVVWWIGSNFSTELSNDLVFSKYVHPKNADPRAQLREFIIRTIVRTTVAISAIFYINFFFSTALPKLTSTYSSIFDSYPDSLDFVIIAKTILYQILLLHIFVVLTRLVLLRKQVFDG